MAVLGKILMSTVNPIFCAIDLPDLEQAHKLALSLKTHVHGLKLGAEFFLAHGAAGYRRMADIGLPIFLDLKLHDIPNTVAGAVTVLLLLRPDFLTIHTAGGAVMMRAAADAATEAAARSKATKPKLLGVTVLTSLDNNDLETVGQDPNAAAQVMRLASLAKASKMDGVICSSRELKRLRKALGPDFILMVPGIRPAWAAVGDQKRVMTPREAMDAGATYLVIGRPITGAENPVEAAERIMEEISAVAVAQSAEQSRP
jgi:orotidine-5'-phosphate decarboxylase